MRCDLCRHDSNGARICEGCLRDVERMLGELPGLVAELATTALRQARGGNGPGGRRGNGDRPLPFTSSPALDLARRSVDVVVEWAGHVVDAKIPAGMSADRLEARAEWATGTLLGALDWFRVDEQASRAAKAVRLTVERLERVLDRPPARITAGPCGALVEDVEVVIAGEDLGAMPGDVGLFPIVRRIPCTATLVVEPGNPVLTCRKCGAEHTAADREAFQRAGLVNAELPLAEILPALPRLLGVEVLPGTVRVWRHRGRLVPVRTTPAGVAVYRARDVMTLALGGNAYALALQLHYRGGAEGHAPKDVETSQRVALDTVASRASDALL